ncbi:MAG: helix-turn-helix transcriptional regulator [Clostridia bacterium]|nr:helix-turn-helix transcriptional regulator [Clostridia bacterium]
METQPQYIQFFIGNTEFTLLLHQNMLEEGDSYYSEVHFHALHELHLLFNGKLCVDTDASMGITLRGPSGCVFPPRMYHRVYLPKDTMFRRISLKFLFKKAAEHADSYDSYSLYKRIFSRSVPLFFDAPESLLSGFWNALKELSERDGGESGSFLSTQIANIISLLFIQIAMQEKPCLSEGDDTACQEYDKSVEYYLRFVQIEQALERVVLNGNADEKIGESLFLSSKQIYRIVEQEYGDNYRNFVRNYRMKRAEFLLKHDEYSVDQISEIVGYNSVSTFSAMFKKVYHVTPLEFRKRFACKG